MSSFLAPFRRSVALAGRNMVIARPMSAKFSSSSDFVDPAENFRKTDEGAIIVENTSFTLEWVLTSPPPLHAFEEPPIMVEWPEGEEGHH